MSVAVRDVGDRPVLSERNQGPSQIMGLLTPSTVHTVILAMAAASSTSEDMPVMLRATV